MKIVYLSALVSKKKNNEMFENARIKPLQSIQKFHYLVCEGLANNSICLETVSIIPMSREISLRKIFFDKKEEENNIKFTYVPFINLKFIRQIFTLIFSFFIILLKIIKNYNKAIFICDVLNTNLSINTLILCKFFKQKCIALVTDLPKDINSNRLSSKINQILTTKYDGYILLTEYMNKEVNPNNKKYVIIEGLVDNKISLETTKRNNKKEKICVYTGGLYEKYGILELIKAFKDMNDEYKLHLYGHGDLVDYLNKNKCKNVIYKGILKNEEIIEIQKEATLLINPRFSNEDYTKYSFPSKIIEYMVSGRPVLTTRLKGIPSDYNDYLYFFDEENEQGFKKTIEDVLSKSVKELDEFGNNAKKFVLENKNNLIQTRKIIEMINEIEEKKNAR